MTTTPIISPAEAIEMATLIQQYRTARDAYYKADADSLNAMDNKPWNVVTRYANKRDKHGFEAAKVVSKLAKYSLTAEAIDTIDKTPNPGLFDGWASYYYPV